ncbi:hypothetical protein A2W13_00200 [Candidatus Woesebacteria bacterium RBG_16_36_11]|uniref:Uncharacterized protein n=2 Tax=Candidatus Woeseibacteriota TaxID=1752722 RepID=A0A1F7X916_9BACT|nr:MAG: hypothetical protein A2W13_00200 [Candidatus Woesebacteria bacterium RBG_16_36_11]OGM17031.1 MAG: hypothetical protein A2V55_02200 [Candidatus Woesebacteria bacterium RBG_19FT_COMBO_37_29]
MDNLKEKDIKNYQTTELNENQRIKVNKDLSFIDFITKKSKEYGYRTIISGGYSVDGNLGQITRPHNDIDIQIYGNKSDSQIIRKLIDEANDGEYLELNLKDKGEQLYYHSYFVEGNGLGADIYYIHVLENPFDKNKIVIKRDSTQTDKHPFNTRNVTLNGVSYEVISPHEQMKDILNKRDRGDKFKSEHNQDLANLELLLS